MPKKPASTVAEILSASQPYADFAASKSRQDELQHERNTLKARVAELEDADLLGVKVVVDSYGQRTIEVGGRRLDVESWRSQRERERSAVAVLDDVEPEVDERDLAAKELSDAVERLAKLDVVLQTQQAGRQAPGLAQQRVDQGRVTATRAVRDELQRAYNSSIAQPLKAVTETLAELADRHVQFNDAIAEADLPDATISGLPIGAFAGHAGSRSSILLGQIEALPR